jgi:hypothetical protein
MAHDQINVIWLGGVWDGMQLDVDKQTALTLLGNVYPCPSYGAPFMILADLGDPAGPLL